MSSGDLTVAPVAALALAPVVVVGAVAYGAYRATEAVVEAYFRSRLAAEEHRSRELDTVARRLRVAGVGEHTGPTDGVANLRATVHALTTRNLETDRRLREEQATLNSLDVQRAALSAQDGTLRRWCEESGLAELPVQPLGHPDVSAVEEARHQIAAFSAAAAVMRADLELARGEIDAEQTRTAFAKLIELPGGREPEPRWRTEMRGRIHDAVVELRLQGGLPTTLHEAAALVETSEDQRQVTESVSAALVELRRLHQISVTELNFRNRVHLVMAQAEAIEHYGIAERCRSALDSVAAKALSAGDGTTFRVWARATAQDLEERMLESLDARAQAHETLAQDVRERAAQALKEAMCAALVATDHYVEVPMETALPSGGRLLIERAEGGHGHTGYAKVVEVRRGTVHSRTVRLSKGQDAAQDATACARQTGRDRDRVEPVLRAYLAERVDQEAITWHHQDAVAVSWQPLSEGDARAVAKAVEITVREDITIARSVPRDS